MADPALSPTLSRMIADIMRRLTAIERTARMPWSSSRGGAFKFQTAGGDDMWVMGNVRLDPLTGTAEYAEDSAYGIFGFGGDSLILWAQEGVPGRVYPMQDIPMSARSAPSGTEQPFPPWFTHASGAFVTGFRCDLYAPVADMLMLDVNVDVDTGSTAEVRLIEHFSGTATTPVTINPPDTRNVRWRWLHPATAGLYDGRSGRLTDASFGVQTRVASGTGRVHMLPPSRATICSSLLFSTAAHPASADGAGRVIS